MKNQISQIQITQMLIDKRSKLMNQSKPQQKLSKLQKDFEIDLQSYPSGTKEQIEYIIVKLLEYPSTQLALVHQKANKLGRYDIKQQTQETEDQQSGFNKKYCEDCGQIIQESDISACTSFETFPIVGLSTYLFFDNIKNLLVLIFLLGAIYSAYSLYINISQSLSTIVMQNFIAKISFASIVKNLTVNNDLYFAIAVQGWLIVGVVMVWWITLFIMKYAQIKKEHMIDSETITAADFGVMIQNIPIQYTKTQLQIEFDAYYRLIKEKKMLDQEQVKPFQITNVVKAIPFYDLDDESIKEQINSIQEKIHDQRQSIAGLIEQIKDQGKFSSTYDQRKKMYEDYLQLQIQKVKYEKKLEELSKDIKSLQAKHLKTIFFITFKHSQSANIIGDLNPYSFSQKLRYYLSCCRKGLPFMINSPQMGELVLRRAPEPEDIIWWNIGIPFCSIILRKFITNFVTLILIASSFAIVYGLTSLQRIYTDSTMISIIVSLTITITNILISISIRKLTLYQCDITETQRQIGLATKSIFAQLINSILTPVITNIYIDNNIYDTNGLVYDIFYLSISSSLVPPLMKFINIPEIIKKIMICYYDRPKCKLSMDQKDLNDIYENRQYELGFAYIYFVNQFYFTCFYVPIQPGIVVFTIIGFILMYWVQKKNLLGFSKRPNPGTNLLNDAMGQLIYFSPCVLSVAMLIWFSVIRQDQHNFSNITYLSHLIAICLSAIFFILPFNSIFKAACYIADDEDLIYSESKQLFTSDYDLANPVTKNDAINELMKKQLQQPNKNQNKSSIALKKALGTSNKMVQESMLHILRDNIQQNQQNVSIEDIIEKPMEKIIVSRVPRKQNNIVQQSVNFQTDYNDDKKLTSESAIKFDDDENLISRCSNFEKKRKSRKSNPTVEDSVSHLYRELVQQRIRSSNGFDSKSKKTPYDGLQF